MADTDTPIVLCTGTFYTEADESRLELALALVRRSIAAGLPIVIADDSPSPTVAARFEAEGATVVKEGGKLHGGGKGGGIRAAFARAVEVYGIGGALLYTEPEKVGIAQFAAQICAPLLDKTAAVVVPRRTRDAFERTYPLEQYHSESFATLYVESAARDQGLNLPSGIDWFFGPFATQRSLASHWLDFPATDWTAQMVPSIKLAIAGSSVVSVEVPYEHPPTQKAEEEGKAKWLRKRLTQINAILPALEQIFAELKNNAATSDATSG
eukprot:TRINITY_DN64472_c0_g1_i1.p1 TRINITY_DN64472_c0_g1~~TRINITY_DN64472_c0_g1_i1.p1  ORF type:complete len:268 (-),score=49.56 TRINITY_DN64472_c0_g1_i1:65-868(-)